MARMTPVERAPQAGESELKQASTPPPIESSQPKHPDSRPFGDERSRAWSVVPFLVIAAALLLYAYPFERTARDVGSSPVPLLFTSDTYLYFTLDRVVFTRSTIGNPWYPLQVGASQVGYLQFPATIAALRLAEGMLGSPSRTLVIWTLFWVLACGIGGYWVLRLLLPRAPALVAGFLALFLAVDLLQLPSVASAWLHPHLASFNIGLPFLRLLFPQTVIPVVCAYLVLQVKALKNARWPWMVMVVLQAIETVGFPFATLYLAIVTAVSVCYSFWKERRPNLGGVVAYAIACGIVDVAAIAALGSLGAAHGGGGEQFSRMAAFLILIGSKKLLLLAALTLTAAFLDGPSVKVKAIMLGCGVANCLLLMGDAVFPVGLQVSNHGMYFVHTTQVLLLAYLAHALFRRPHLGRFAVPVAAVLLFASLLHGALVARATYAGKLSFNRYQAGAFQALSRAHVTSSDLVIAPAQYVDDTACWVPLMTGARVLFCRDAEMAMTSSQMQQFEPQRLALYLYFRGADQEWLRAATATPQAAEDYAVARIAERLTLQESGDTRSVLQSIRSQLGRGLEAAESHDPQVQETLRRPARVLVVDSASAPVFLRERLEQYLEPTGEADSAADGVEVRAYRARASSSPGSLK